MKAEVKIPKGWRRLRRNEAIHKGDKFRVQGMWVLSVNWIDLKIKVGECASSIYIRKVKRATREAQP